MTGVWPCFTALIISTPVGKPLTGPMTSGDNILNTTQRLLAGAALLLAAGSGFAAGSLSVMREATLDAAPTTAWKLIGNFNGLDVWHPALAGSTGKGSGTAVGSTRALSLVGGGTIDEKLTAYSAAKHSLSYAILKSPLPVKNYASTMTVSPTADGKSLVKWTSTFDASGADDAKAKEVIGGIYDAGLGKATAIFKK